MHRPRGYFYFMEIRNIAIIAHLPAGRQASTTYGN